MRADRNPRGGFRGRGAWRMSGRRRKVYGRGSGRRGYGGRHGGSRRGGRAKRLLAPAAGLALFLAAALIWYGYGVYQERQQALALAESWEPPVRTEEDERLGDIVEYQGRTYRRNTYVRAVLLLGIDRAETLEETQVAGSGGQADAIFLAAQDTARDSLRLLMIPRDTMTPITLTDLSGNVLGQDVQHLTLAYAYGDGREKSCAYTKEAVSGLLEGLAIDGVMAVSVGALPVLNEAVGGVRVQVEDASLAEAYPEFELGETIQLYGKSAEIYIRYRDTDQPQSALARTERQKSYIQGFVRAAKETAAREEGFVPRLLDAVEPYMVTDMDKGTYMDMALAFLAGSQSFGEEDMITLPGTAVETPIYDEYHVDEEQILPIVLDLFYREAQ